MIRGSMNIAASQPKLSGRAIRVSSRTTSAGSLRVRRATCQKRMRAGEALSTSNTMAFGKGKPRPPNAGRKKGSRYKATERIRKLSEPLQDGA